MDKVLAIHRLRVNIKSLAAEAKIIHQEEKRAGLAYRSALHLHRVGRLREEARLSYLALAYIREMPYNRVEQTVKPISVSKLVDKINRFYSTSDSKVKDWLGAKQ